MPFKSKAQMRKFFDMETKGEISKKELKDWLDATTNPDKLPERVKPKKKSK